jgi:hypothetical protein
LASSYSFKVAYSFNFFGNEWWELCLSIKEGVKEFYVQVREQQKGRTEEGKCSGKEEHGYSTNFILLAFPF